MMYRQIQQVRDQMGELQQQVRAAILSEDTRDMTRYGGAAQAMADGLDRELRNALTSDDSATDPKVEPAFAQAAQRAFSMAVTEGERIALGTDVTSVRDGLLRLKTQVDFADAYIRAALGATEE